MKKPLTSNPIAQWFSTKVPSGQTPGSSHSGSASSADAVVKVNGKAISRELLDQVVAANVSQGQVDSSQLRLALIEDLINRELIAQDALNRQIDQSPSARLQLQQAQGNVLIDLAMSDLLVQAPIEDSELRAEYDRQVESLNAMGPLQQYQLRLLLLSSETEAREAIASIKAGASMELLATEASLDPSRENGGLLDWLLPHQMFSTIANVVVNVPVGQIIAAPIQTQAGWQVIRVEEVRPFTVPTFEAAKIQLTNAVTQQRRAAYLAQLRESARIDHPLALGQAAAK
jgi:peptidyl-prolyl cis-trans isomerase C